ncbi:MAG TPA: glycoside hydrolase family 44 protein [Stellaceae bacterium]|nr:glycoside hydrolase family 44 protein [Stellaceae bacterium]
MLGLAAALPAFADTPSAKTTQADMTPLAVTVDVDATANRHPISPLIYGVNFASSEELDDLNAPINRSGGNSTSMYNWQLKARNAGKDWYYESQPCDPKEIDDLHGDDFVQETKAGHAQPMITIPMIGWVAKLGPNRQPLASFSIGKYGLQEDNDAQGFADAGNGIALDGAPITDNDPNDAAMPDDVKTEQAWVKHLTSTFGNADSGGVRYYLMDNEPSVWQLIHRDVHPAGAHAKEIADKVMAYSRAVKSVDPGAKVVAPEEWGWNGYLYSGFDQQFADTHGYDNAPDRTSETGGMDYVPWLLTQWKAAGHPIDVFSLHFYPQGGEYAEQNGDNSAKIQLERNRSTRDLWDPNYKDPTWIDSVVQLIPRMRHWVDTYYYPGTPIAITEYSWGGEKLMNGATAQADILGIFGREGLDIATRWATPDPSTPVYKAMKLYRNYDNHKSAFGETSIAAKVPDPDTVSAFAASRAKDDAITVMVINKQLDRPADLSLKVAHYMPGGTIETFQVADNKLSRLAPGSYHDGTLDAKLPAQSITLFILHGQSH